MEKKIYSLDIRENNLFTRIVLIIFGSVCILISGFWLIFNLKASGNEGAQWVTIIFLAGFGLYQIYSGLGYAARFIEVDQEKIKLKTNPVLPAREILPASVERIESFPLNIIFHLKPEGKVRLRFGTTYPEKIDTIKDSVSAFAGLNNIPVEIKVEII